MLKHKAKDIKNTLTDEEWHKLGEQTDMYSCSDISAVSNDAYMMPVRKCQRATHFKIDPDGMHSPCSPTDPNGKEMDMYSVPKDMLQIPPVDFNDYIEALTVVKPSVTAEDLKRHQEFTAQFGLVG